MFKEKHENNIVDMEKPITVNLHKMVGILYTSLYLNWDIVILLLTLSWFRQIYTNIVHVHIVMTTSLHRQHFKLKVLLQR